MSVHLEHSSLFQETVCKEAPLLIILKNLDGTIREMNQHAASLFGYQHWKDSIGKKESEYPCPAAKTAPIWLEQDRRVIQHNQRLTILDLNFYAENEMKVLLTKKIPLKDPMKKTIGIMCIGFEICDALLAKLMTEFSKIQINIKSKKEPVSLSIERNTAYYNLSSRESECLFFLLRGKSATEIASLIGLSKRTVEEYLNNVKEKMRCSTRSALIECCIKEGYIHIIPKSLLPTLSEYLESESIE